MTADHVLPRRHSGECRDQTDEASLTGDEASEVFRSLYERLQRLDSGNADRAAADADQLAADIDQALSASDQAAFEKYHPGHASSWEKPRPQAPGVTELRALNMHERIQDASRRDKDAGLRDMEADVRDRTAESRDKSAEDHGRAFGREARYATTRDMAHVDRQQSSEDRARAANDRRKSAEDREHALVELKRSQLDDLTGCYRLGFGKVMLQREIDRSRREDGRLVLAYCDIDDLKHINDEKGHAAGDAVLQGFAEAMRSRLRSYDPVVRVGGDEFVCALSHVEISEAQRTLEDVQTAFAEHGPGDCSMTFGLAGLQPKDSLTTLMEQSDVALRDAKLAA